MGLLNKKTDYDLAVLGSGAGGSTAAVMAAKAGLEVALIEERAFGGDAANFSDIPMAALQTATNLLEQATTSSEIGLSSSSLRYNYSSLMSWKNEVKKRAGIGNNRKFYEKLGIKTIPGHAVFLSPHEISVGKTTISAKKFLIATGAEYKSEIGLSGIKNIENVPHLTPATALNLKQPPKSLLIIGGGATGVELAQYFAILGTKVLIAEISNRLLPEEDEEVGQLVDQIFNINYAIKVLVGARVISAHSDALGTRVVFARDGQKKSLKVENILVATGKAPAIDIGLENAKVQYDEDDGILVNEFLQTSAKHIYAAGDIIGGDSSTGRAVYQSQVAGSNLLHKNATSVDYSGTPRLTNIMPVVASVGLSEDDAIKSDIPIQKAFIPLANTSASNIANFRNGFVKLIADKKGLILGGTIASPEAASLISELSIAVRYQMSSSDLASLPRPFLSWSEGIRLAALQLD